MVNCAVYMCKRRSKNSNLRNHNVSYHKFPRDPTIRQEWRTFCNRNNKWHPTQTSAICSDHFTPSSFKVFSNIKRILNKGAIPTLRTCYCSKTKQEQCNKNEESPKRLQTSKKEPSKNVAITKCKKSKSNLNDKNKTIKKLRDNNRYLKNRVVTLKETVTKLQEKSIMIKEESNLEENQTFESVSMERYNRNTILR